MKSDRVIHTRITTPMWDALRDHAQDAGLTVAQFTRHALKRAITHDTTEGYTQHILSDVTVGRPKKRKRSGHNNIQPAYDYSRKRTRPNAFSPAAIARGLATGTVVNKLKEPPK